MLHVRGTPISVTALVHESLAKEHQAHVIFTIRVRPNARVEKKANINRRTTAILTKGTWDGESMGTLIAEGKAVALKKCRNQEWPSDAFSETPFRVKIRWSRGTSCPVQCSCI